MPIHKERSDLYCQKTEPVRIIKAPTEKRGEIPAKLIQGQIIDVEMNIWGEQCYSLEWNYLPPHEVNTEQLPLN